MGITKTEIFTEEQNQIAKIAKVIGHPARVAIIEYLIRVDQCICGDLVEEIGLAQPTISQHLRELKNVGLIKGNIEGTSVCYCIDPINWNHIKALFSSFFDTYKNEACDEQCC
ncbi:DNA-binding transcriptional regulator, ArsR family [Zhouia amylolytica]|uniref:Regulatory protein ArsR n=2 Tax=Zhouia amylolytica TaxID=376730 RepID=W2USN3_9FLAO|nr:metalloregulator ArsR/SmtB family transcription factor [Zhouia amylolytica]ETN96984.1 regulatory protein ArsR [Zhouia amylolytica AD3]MCQ0110171.1 winged helix-turn-helix transcriptional regulator [Zhouia amylolytica]SFT06162.1 DNA-binding transcriptional regulator, ArsR family [Zhouia amylolytica]